MECRRSPAQSHGLRGEVVRGGEVILLMDEGKPVAKLVATDPEEAGGHLANVQGWLEDDHPFFSAIGRDRTSSQPTPSARDLHEERLVTGYLLAPNADS